MRISDWSSDVCSSDLRFVELPEGQLQVQRESELQLRWRPVALGRKLRVESICRHWPGTGFGHVDYLARLGSTRMPDRGVCARPCTKMVQCPPHPRCRRIWTPSPHRWRGRRGTE